MMDESGGESTTLPAVIALGCGAAAFVVAAVAVVKSRRSRASGPKSRDGKVEPRNPAATSPKASTSRRNEVRQAWSVERE
mmetsp:Transcript_26466/g.92049  ORF Transcript_26466/g.92049 Transcript_26466/m.92049 type:complete len:80 (-) Transcript_26466:82-321(-)